MLSDTCLTPLLHQIRRHSDDIILIQPRIASQQARSPARIDVFPTFIMQCSVDVHFLEI